MWGDGETPHGESEQGFVLGTRMGLKGSHGPQVQLARGFSHREVSSAVARVPISDSCFRRYSTSKGKLVRGKTLTGCSLLGPDHLSCVPCRLLGPRLSGFCHIWPVEALLEQG